VTVQTGGDVPILDTGILTMGGPGEFGGFSCFWTPDPELAPGAFAEIIKLPLPDPVPQLAQWQFIFEQTDPFIIFVGRHDVIVSPCDGIFELPKINGPAAWGDAKIFPIKWFQNANDVPH